MIKTLGRVLAIVASLAALTSQSAAGQGAPVTNLTDDELETFAEAYVEVIRIAGEVEAALVGVQDAQQAQSIQANGQEQMAEVLDEHDLTTERYRSIGDALNQDDELRERFLVMLDEVQDGAL
jgi:predicted secreted Zn-dependent protease